ncbi:MAG: hypothetical protein IPL62_02980 [Caulobacteraceae bacterium]|nr:hypothetical protein [Caulobacteraceae bacterium]
MAHKETRPNPKPTTPPQKPKKVRDAGPDAMANPPRKWTDVDEASDESFPASDAPSKY